MVAHKGTYDGTDGSLGKAHQHTDFPDLSSDRTRIQLLMKLLHELAHAEASRHRKAPAPTCTATCETSGADAAG